MVGFKKEEKEIPEDSITPKKAMNKKDLYILLSHEKTMVNQISIILVVAAMLLTAAAATALYAGSSAAAQMSMSVSNKTSGAKNMTNATSAGNMTKNMTSGSMTNKTK